MSDEENVNTQPIPQKDKWTLSESLIIAGTPIIAYLIAFLYEWGYTKAFNIPRQFVRIDLTTIFIAFGVIWAFPCILFIIRSILMGLIRVIPNFKNTPIYKTILEYHLIFIFLLAGLFFSRATLWECVFGAFIIIMLLIKEYFLKLIQRIEDLLGLAAKAIIECVMKLIKIKKKSPSIRRSKKEQPSPIEESSPIHSSLDYLGVTRVWIVFYFVVLLIIAYIAGYMQGYSQEEFYVSSNLKPSIVSKAALLRSYGDTLIFAVIDDKDRIDNRNFVVTKVAEETTSQLTFKKIHSIKSGSMITVNPFSSISPSPSPSISPSIPPSPSPAGSPAIPPLPSPSSSMDILDKVGPIPTKATKVP